MRIELIVYSGRKNPSWHLNGEDAELVWDVFRGLSQEPMQEGPPLAPRWGYKGFRLEDREGILFTYLRVWRTRVGYYRGDASPSHFCEDPERSLEKVLLKLAKGKMPLETWLKIYQGE